MQNTFLRNSFHGIRNLILFILLLTIHNSFGQNSIIPKPASIIIRDSFFRFENRISVVYDHNVSGLKNCIADFSTDIKKRTGADVALKGKSKKQITINITPSHSSNKEAYQLKITPAKIEITASTLAGVFYAFQSMLQCMPLNAPNNYVDVRCMEISDQPQFGWRGMHLDVSRHFFGPEVIYQYIDLLAYYKMNTFHWHLTDDQGWRIEIKKYPNLTQTGAWRVDYNDSDWSARPQALPGQKPTYGGFYTQKEIRKIVAYAARKQITIVPEIEMPGHSAAALAAYPNLGCTHKPQLPLTGGNYKDISSVYCAGNDSVFIFLEDVLKEVIQLFPSKYIHIGGDEVDKEQWLQCAVCKTRMQQMELCTAEELQSYFIRRIDNYLSQQGRTLIGWDEILEGGLSANAVVMSWRGETGGIAAARQKHNVVMTPGTPCYFDHYQGDPKTEPKAIGGFNTLKLVYNYQPVPESLRDSFVQYVQGSQGNVWTEYIPSTSQLQYMILPRMPALSEALWTANANKDWNNFYARISNHFMWYEKQKLNYSKGNTTVEFVPSNQDGKLILNMKSEIPDAQIVYTTDGYDPDEQSSLYSKPLEVNQSMTVKAALMRDQRVISKLPSSQYFAIHKGIGSTVTYINPPSKYYPAEGPNSIVNGIRGQADHHHNWQGINKNDLSVTIALPRTTRVQKLSIGFLQNYNAWIFYPSFVSFEVGADSLHFMDVGAILNTDSMTLKGAITKDFTIEFPAEKVKYIRITAKSPGLCPIGHPGAGKAGWIFFDECVVE